MRCLFEIWQLKMYICCNGNPSVSTCESLTKVLVIAFAIIGQPATPTLPLKKPAVGVGGRQSIAATGFLTRPAIGRGKEGHHLFLLRVLHLFRTVLHRLSHADKHSARNL